MTKDVEHLLKYLLTEFSFILRIEENLCQLDFKRWLVSRLYKEIEQLNTPHSKTANQQWASEKSQHFSEPVLTTQTAGSFSERPDDWGVPDKFLIHWLEVKNFSISFQGGFFLNPYKNWARSWGFLSRTYVIRVISVLWSKEHEMFHRYCSS